MRSIVRGVVALFAAFCIIDVAKAAPTIVSPADYSKVSPFSLAFKNIIEDGSLGPDGKFATKDGKIIWSNPYFGYSDYYRTVNGVKETNPNSKRVADRILSRENSLPVTLKWGNSSGSCTVKLWRTKKDTESAPQFTVTTTENSVKFYDLEIGRNYTWTVTDSTGKATGHFYVMNESKAPRILLHDQNPNASGSDTSNTRDIGGYRTYKGSKVIKQGLIYRTAELEWCNPTDANGMRQELTYLKNTLGIKFDMDFRNYTDLQNKLAYVGANSITEHGWRWAWKNGSYLNLNESNIGEGVVRLNINKLTGTQFGSYTGLVPKKSGMTTANINNRKNVWCAFTNVADSAKWPLVFHCSHGKDRAGTFALVLHGVLDIPKEIALKDFAFSWFDSPDETLNPVNMANTITNLFSYTSYSSNNDADYRFKEQCYNFLVQCGKDAGVTEANAKSKIDSFVSAMTEDAEEPDVNPALSTNRETDGDTFSYTTIYHRRNGGGGSLGSDNGSTLNYIYSSSTTTSTHAPKGDLNTYDTCLCFWPVDGLPYSSPVCGYNKVGKIVTYGRYAPAGVGPYNFKMYFSSEGHSVTDRTIIEHRSGVGNYENVDLYFTTYDSSNLGEGNKNAAYVYKGSSAAIEVWANATMRVRDIRDMSQKRTSKAYKAYLKFPKGSCDNARFESLEIDGDGENLLGWFTGGEVGTRQYVKVVNSILQFNAPSKTSGVEGALGLEFSLGSVNTTSSAAMLKVAGTLNINAGSTITVDAGRKGAGTYKLVSAGTLNDYANLAFNYSVSNCANGYYGVVVRDGNNLNLVVQEGEPPEEDPEDIGDADEGDWGYRVRGLGSLKNETALVFTNSAMAANWVIPSKLENVQFLVVGGGGGGGADTCASDAYSGGGGGVVTGLVSFAENSYVTITVGKGGAGGTEETKYNSQYGASASGGNSMFITSDGLRATAFGGGGSGGISGGTKVRTTVESGPAGGSTAGGRAKSDADKNTFAGPVATATKGEVVGITVYGAMGNNGGESTGNYAGGGGGGAMGKGGDTAGEAANGGPGYESNITGSRAVYGSGGGGSVITGVGGLGGEGAGNGNSSAGASGTDGLANQGGGGGAGGRGDLDSVTKGGNGGSGIVVLRYVDPTSAPVDPENPDIKLIAEPAVIPNLVFNGNEQNGVITGEGYTLSGVTKAEAAGTYEAIATLKTGYKWLDGTTESKTITWSIAKFTNIWTIEPSISLASWITGATPGELNMGVAKFGTVTATMNGAAFTELPTAVGTYSIVCTVEATSNYTALSETITFEILPVPVINPTEYGTADSAASTYTWIGYTGPWMYTTNWTVTASGTYGVPNNGTYATADFPAALENAFTCTLNQSVSVNKAEFNSPNMTFVLDNALLTLKGKVDSYAACDFGDGENDNSTIELRGANAGIVSASNEVRLNFGYRHGDVTPTGTVTVRFVVPETGWESDARIKATGGDSKVVFYENSKLEIDATALGVPAEGTTKTVYLASGTGDNGVYVSSSATNIVCAAGAKGSIKIENKKLVLTVEADETTEPDEPQEPQLTAVDVPVAQVGLVYTGSELTGVVSATGYTLAGNTATDAGEYTAIATLAEGYKWSDDTTADKSITWSIAKATNEWTTEPKIEPATWTEGSAGTYTAGVAKSGTEVVVMITNGGAASDVSLDNLNSWTAGSYSITFTVDESKNYSSLSKEVTVTVNVSENEEPGDDPVSQIPTIPAEWGYVKTDLGDLHNEVAVVFTNHVDKAMSWTVPADIENVQFLVVGGGGGGGGAVNANKGGAGGAGGGGGCVVTGIVNKLVKDAVVSVQVGNGGNGGTYNSSATADNGKASHGESSLFKVGNVTYVTAFGGAGDLGYNKDSGVNNGSNSGSRYNDTRASAAVGTAATWDQTALSDKLSNVATFRNKGGNNANNKTYSSGGGGGAIEAGQAPGSSSYGGYGGKGLTSSITDVEKMYGSGGSGATAKNGGYEIISPDGAGSSYPAAKGTDGADNQGGGGGGGGYQSNGGKGGSGIVVFRYTLKSEVKVDAKEYIESKLTDKVYTGSLLMSGLTDDTAYTVSEEGGVNVGEYTVTVTLKSGFVWADGNTSSTSNFTWKIAKNANEWATEPLLSVTSWAQGYAPNVKFVAPVQTIGELNATITTNGVTEAFSGTLPTEPGDYTINYSVTETDNYAGRTWGVSFKIYRSEPIEGGYKVFGLGEDGNEEAMVFTQSGSWNIDKNLKNVQFLVVGGGGGGGADISTSNEVQAGSGGGGGGVVTGLVNFAAGQTVAVTVGAGGQGGERGGSTSPYGAVKTQAENSSFAIGTETSVVAYAGGGDTGSTVSGGNNNANTTGGQTGGNGGSSAGSRATATGRGEATCGSVNDTANAIICSNTLGNKGGAGAAQYQAGGGGGATTEGEDGTENAGGNGGEGLASNIIGTDLVYGSGGGGGAVAGSAQGPGLGGSGAGNGGQRENATSAVANQGGGGGGGGRAGNGGNGGSGIVVFRYVVPAALPEVDGEPVDADKVFVSANTSTIIWYPAEPEVVTNAANKVVVAFGGSEAEFDYTCYDVIKSVADKGYQIKLVIKKELLSPVIAETENEDGSKTPAIRFEDGEIKIHLEGTHERLYYKFETSTDLSKWDDAGSAMGKEDFKYPSTAPVRFFRLDAEEPVTDINPAATAN